MTLEWRVTYTVESEIRIKPVTTSIPEFGLELEYSAGGKVVKAIHTLQLDDSYHADTAFNVSKDSLARFWEALRYAYRQPIDVRATGAEAPGKVGTQATISYEALAAPVTSALPDANRLLSAPAEVTTWLHLANAARGTSDDADALRILHIILEGMERHDPNITYDPQIKYVRHFVSHALIDREPALSFLQSQLGQTGPVRYDPLNHKHRRLVYKYRQEARRLVDARLQKHL